MQRVFLTLVLVAMSAQGVDLTGHWYGEASVQGAKGSIGLTIVADGEGLTAALSLPPIGVYGLPVGPVTQAGEQVQIGPSQWRIVDGELIGVLPRSLVPGRDVGMVLRRVQQLPVDTTAKPEVPAVQPRWQTALGTPVYADPVWIDEGLVIAGVDGCVYWLGAAGEIRHRSCLEGPIRARPARLGQDLLVHADDGFLYRLDEAGQVIWRVAVEAREVPRGAYELYSPPPVLVGDTIYVGARTRGVVAFDLDGTERWRQALPGAVLRAAAPAGDLLIVGSLDGRVYALDRANGAVRWTFDTGAAVTSEPQVADGYVLIGSRSYDFFALGLDDGAPRWRNYLWFSWIESSAAVADGMLYLGSSDAQSVRAMSVDSGELHWSFQTAGAPWARPALSPRSVIAATLGNPDYMIAHRAAVYALHRSDGRARWVYWARPGEGLHGYAAAPLWREGVVYAVDTGGRVVAIEEAATPH